MTVLRFANPECCFVRIPKSASTSLINAFLGGVKNSVERVDGPALPEWQNYKSFCFTRHPLRRFESAYKMFSGYPTKHPQERKAKRNLSVASILELLEDDSVKPAAHGNYFEKLKLHTIPMTHAYFGLASVKKVFRFEALEEDWNSLAAYLDIPVPTATHMRKEENKISLSDVEADLVRAYFKADFEAFDYE